MQSADGPCGTQSQLKSHLISTAAQLHPFNGLFSGTKWVSRHQKGKPFWIVLEQKMMGWLWHQLDHMQIMCILLQIDNNASTTPPSFTGRMPFLPTNQQRQSTEDTMVQKITFDKACSR